ncbi:DUF4148 domain-containing protein [Acidovorax sp. Root267]|uniref:DUF4148 domain-containing protein n=1 Tax=Acidovorax sp. Root267 TaxID=1736505 RepID=UPI0009E91414|nr:DUF4148 domain-containing protein [Acidovorax sp. Root267]
MQSKFFAIALILAAGPALADDITVDTTPFTSTRSRAEVQAELRQFQSSGVDPWSRTYNPLDHFQSKLTRSEVTRDYLLASEEAHAVMGEDSGSSYFARAASPSGSGSVAHAPSQSGQSSGAE